MASGLLVRPMGGGVAKQPLRGSLPSRWRAWLSALELMGSLCCPGSASSSTSATFTMERSLSKATPQHQPKCLLHGQSPLAQRGYTRHLQGLFNPLLGYVALNDTPLFGARKLMGIVQVLLQQHWLSLDLYGQSSIDQACTVQTTKTLGLIERLGAMQGLGHCVFVSTQGISVWSRGTRFVCAFKKTGDEPKRKSVVDLELRASLLGNPVNWF